MIFKHIEMEIDKDLFAHAIQQALDTCSESESCVDAYDMPGIVPGHYDIQMSELEPYRIFNIEIEGKITLGFRIRYHNIIYIGLVKRLDHKKGIELLSVFDEDYVFRGKSRGKPA